MEYRTLEINVISAKDLKKVNLITKMDVYVIVSISGGKKQKQRTSVDRDGDDSPSWNFPMKFTIEESAAQKNRLALKFKLRCDRILGDKDIGKVRVPVKELLDSAKEGTKSASYQVQRPSGKPKGQLTFSFKLDEKVSGAVAMMETKGDQPMTAYPAAGPSSGYPLPPAPYPVATSEYPYPPPPPAGGYPPPPPPAVAGYGHPPPPYGGYPAPPPPYGGYSGPPPPPGYGYPPPPPVQQAPKKKSNFGMGLGAGLLGGALGGLLIGDMISDDGFGDGFGDAGF